MEDRPDNLKNLSQSARDWFVRILAAGSAGYGEFLKALSNYISAGEAANTEQRFRRAQKALLWVTLAFIAAFLAANWLLGPWDLRAAGLANDLLRAVVFAGSIYLARQKRVAVASQALLPLATLCFLPFRQTPAPDWTGQPASFGALMVALFFIGWLLDYGGGVGERKWLPVRALSCVIGGCLFLVVLIIGWRLVTDGAWFPIFSLLAAVAAAPWYAIRHLRRMPIPPIAAPPSDEPFLYEAAWRRWRFFFTGRLLAVFLGAAPFLLFANQLDYQEALEKCLHISESPTIIRQRLPHIDWWAYYWEDQGRFLTVEDLQGTPPEPREADTQEALAGSQPAPVPAAAPGVSWDDAPGQSQPRAEAASADAPKGDGVIRDIYYLDRDYPELDNLPARFRGPQFAADLPPYEFKEGEPDEKTKMANRITRLTGHQFVLSDFRLAEAILKPWRVDSLGRLVNRSDNASSGGFYCLSWYPSTDPSGYGTLIGEQMNIRRMDQGEIDKTIQVRSRTKWLFFVIGVFGCIFLWRRGGDSVVSRWVGIWLIGASAIPSMNNATDTLSRTAHWFWEQSILYHWNTVGAMLGPLFFLIYGALFFAAFTWLLQLEPMFCWVHVCWPTRIHPQFSSFLRRLLVLLKLFVVVSLIIVIFIVGLLVQKKLAPFDWDGFSLLFIMGSITLFMLLAGSLLRIWTARASELPHINWIAVAAFVVLNLSLACYIPISFPISQYSSHFSAERIQFIETVCAYVGSSIGWIFVAMLTFLILRRDFLRVRAISGFAALLLLIAVPYGVHWMEDEVTPMLGNSPFFRQQGAEMVTIMLVMFLFPLLHEWLHEQLLNLSVPMLRRIEHHLEHSLEKIVDAESDHERVEMVSELLTEVGVKQYVLLSRRPGGRFAVDIDTLSRHAADPHNPATTPATPPEIEVSEKLREFLGKRRHFIDLTSIAYEWSFFFHQFELYRLTHGPAVGGGQPARFVLPICVGESLRGILLLGEGPLESVISTPALSNNLNNLGLAAAMSRRAPRDLKK